MTLLKTNYFKANLTGMFLEWPSTKCMLFFVDGKFKIEQDIVEHKTLWGNGFFFLIECKKKVWRYQKAVNRRTDNAMNKTKREKNNDLQNPT